MLERTATVVMLIWSLGPGSMAPAADTPHPICRVLLIDEQSEREDLALDVLLADSLLTAHEEIFALLHGLWKNDAVDRMQYLKGKHDRDIAKLDRERRALLVERQDALLDQYRLLCGDGASQEAYNRAQESYLEVECDRLAKRVEIARVDLEYSLVLLESVHDLRENDVATRPDVILTELEVADARQRLADGERRVRQCRPEGDLPESAP